MVSSDKMIQLNLHIVHFKLNTMKPIFFLIFTIFSIPQFHLHAQKFRTIEQYQTYFREKDFKTELIEGIWDVTTSVFADGKWILGDKYTVAIVNESGSFSQYEIENGHYKPNSGYKKFIKDYAGYVCVTNPGTCDVTMRSIRFYLDINQFMYELDLTPYLACMSNRNPGIIFLQRYTHVKMYPLESDIIENKKEKIKKKSTGTGIAISSDGYIATNYHVIENASSIKVRGINGSFATTYPASVVIVDKNNDLAIIKVDNSSLPTLGQLPFTIKSSSSNVGESVFVLGYPLTATMGEEIKVTNGIISSRSGFQGDITTYQISAPIQPGNSGAPMFDKDGNVVGIVNAKHLNAENVSYAIKSNYLLNLVDASPKIIVLPTKNILQGKQLPEQISIVKKYIYLIEIH